MFTFYQLKQLSYKKCLVISVIDISVSELSENIIFLLSAV